MIEKIDKSHFYGSNIHTRKNIGKIVSENEYIINSSKYLNAWLYRRGIRLYIISKISKLDLSIPRINGEKLYNETVKMDLSPYKITATDNFKIHGFRFQPRILESIFKKIQEEMIELLIDSPNAESTEIKFHEKELKNDSTQKK